MLTYQVRERLYKLEKNRTPTFPNAVKLVFVFQPLQPFGKDAAGGRTTVRAKPASVLFNANSGHHFVQSKDPLSPLEVIIEEPARTVELKGNKLHIVTHCQTLTELDELVQSVFFAFPILLNIEFGDPPIVERVEGKIGDAPFGWELRNWTAPVYLTTQELQEEKVALSWSRFDLLSPPGNRRLVAALHYFHVACRLCRAGNSPWEFMSETILNLSKVLEVLFPPAGDGQTLDAARQGLRKLGYAESEIEIWFIPAMCLRSHIDSAHVDLSVFTREQLHTLHAYTESAEDVFRSMLSKLISQVEGGQFELKQYAAVGARKEALDIISKLSQHLIKVKKLPHA